MNYSISIILPILNEINSLKKTLLIINKIKVDKEFIVIYSEKLTKNSVKDEINSLKKKYKNLKYFRQIRPFVGGAIDLGITKAKKKYIAIMASDMETNPNELKNMINISSKNYNSIISADRWISHKGFSDYGVIKFIGTKSGYGRTVQIKHGGNISTLYAHMESFNNKLKVGSKVSQGQTIGYVGDSGAATGTHLHYEFKVGSKRTDPMRVKLPSAQPVPAEQTEDFFALLAENNKLLERFNNLDPNAN